jgi:hypothetical protein
MPEPMRVFIPARPSVPPLLLKATQPVQVPAKLLPLQAHEIAPLLQEHGTLQLTSVGVSTSPAALVQ